MSDSIAFATGCDLTSRFDFELVGDLCSDRRESLSESQAQNHPNVRAALEDASGEVVMALIAGGRYTESQLHQLTGVSRNNLIRIVCDIAMSHLVSRRCDSGYIELAEKLARQARTHLNSLKLGENILGIPELQQSGTMELSIMSSHQLDDLNTLPTRMNGFFPPNANRTIRGF